MAEYIDRNLIEWYGCDFEDDSCKNKECSGCYHAECSHSQVMNIPTADVVERHKYEVMCIKCNNLEDKIEAQDETIKRLKENQKTLEAENKELRSKIKMCMDILNRSIDEN